MLTKDQIVDCMVHWVGSKVVSMNYEWNQMIQQWELINRLIIILNKIHKIHLNKDI